MADVRITRIQFEGALELFLRPWEVPIKVKFHERQCSMCFCKCFVFCEGGLGRIFHSWKGNIRRQKIEKPEEVVGVGHLCVDWSVIRV